MIKVNNLADYLPIPKWAQGNHIILKIGEPLLTMVRDRWGREEWSVRQHAGFEDGNKGHDLKYMIKDTKNTRGFQKLEQIQENGVSLESIKKSSLVDILITAHCQTSNPHNHNTYIV